VWIGNPEGRPIRFTPIDARDLSATDEMLRALQEPWARTLSVEEADALDDYKGLLGRAMNAQLRGETSDFREAANARLISNALSRARAPADMLLYRAVGEAEVRLYCANRRLPLRTASFVSTTIARDVAEVIARRAACGTVVEFEVRKGQQGVAYVHPFPRYRYRQYEVLLNVGLTLKVKRADAVCVRLEVVHDDSTG